MPILNILTPVFAIIALGALLRRTGFLTDPFQRGLNRLAYAIGLPCLLFLKTAQESALNAESLQCLLILLGATIGVIGLAFLCARLMKLPSPSTGAFVQIAYRSNNAYVGLPLVTLTFASLTDPATADRAFSMAALVLGPTIIFYNLTGIPLLLLTGPRATNLSLAAKLQTGLKETFKNPLVIGILAGAGWRLIGLPLPDFAERTAALLGQVAMPSALLCIGYAMGAPPVQHRAAFKPALAAALLKNLVAPLLGVLLIGLLKPDPLAAGVALLVLACPSALACFVLAEELQSDAELTAAAIFLSTLLALPGLSLLIPLLDRLLQTG